MGWLYGGSNRQSIDWNIRYYPRHQGDPVPIETYLYSCKKYSIPRRCISLQICAPKSKSLGQSIGRRHTPPQEERWAGTGRWQNSSRKRPRVVEDEQRIKIDKETGISSPRHKCGRHNVCLRTRATRACAYANV
uniref:Uncharacterized protein n=1 Tax=Hyaloperonospora arabidopsidis (strain Emoy2) TaxID=559515 RepID=M4C3I5_HYAAE